MKTAKTNALRVAASALLLLSGSVHAALCSNTDVTINQIGVATTSGTTWSSVSPINNAVECTGATIGNTMPTPQSNLGYYGDGLFNGEQQVASHLQLYPNGIFSDQYTAVDLNHDGTADPGWIYLGRWENGSFTTASIGGNTTIVLSNWFTVTGTGSSGTWAFTPDANVVSRVLPVLGSNLFDQFLLSFKSGDDFAAYDFTGKQLGLPVSSSTIYNFSGNWDMSGTLQNCSPQGDTCQSAGLSHVDLYVRDPNGGETVPEPAGLALISLGLLGLALSRRRL